MKSFFKKISGADATA